MDARFGLLHGGGHLVALLRQRQGKLFTNQGQGLLDNPIGEVHSRCHQSLDDRTGGGKKALALRAEDQSQGSDEGHLKNLSAATSRQVIHNGN